MVTTAKQIIEALPFKQFKSHRAHDQRNKKAIEAAGYRAVKARYDNAGNCTVCHEAGRCPGYHVYQETPSYRLAAIGAFWKLHGIKRLQRKEWDYVEEHDRLWIVGKNGAQYAVNDTAEQDGTDGFDFEMVTPPESDE